MTIITRLEGLERIYFDNEYCAELAGLKYIADTVPGWRRVKNGEEFDYVEKDKSIEQKFHEYCRTLAIPPAWTDVWINKDKNGHLLVTGFDEKRRKQYMYHPRWKQIRELVNFYRALLLAISLPRIRFHVQKHLELAQMKKSKIVALVISIMMKRPIRIGNELYAETNNTYGLTTLEKRHVKVKGSKVTFKFVGKSNKKHTRDITDALIASMIETMLEIEGKRLFKYISKDGSVRSVKPDDVNEFLQRISTYRITAKDFRTWVGSLEAYQVLKKQGIPETKKESKEEIKEAVATAADTLGNTPAIAKKSYIHPRLIQSFEDKTFFEIEPKTRSYARRMRLRLKKPEKELLSFLNYFLEEDIRKIRDGSINSQSSS